MSDEYLRKLVSRKGRLILQINDQQNRLSKERVRTLRREVAELEGMVAQELLHAGDKAKAAGSLVNQAAYLVDAGDLDAARRVIDATKELTSDPVTINFLDTLMSVA